MDFARKQMEKFGWMEGKGLGKDSQGILSAIKPSLKVGKEGMGYDLSKELVDTWWTRAYDDSVNRINIEENGTSDTVGVSLQDDSDGEERSLVKTSSSVERPFEKMRKRMMKASFPTFSKGATLSNGEMITVEKSATADSSGDDDDPTTKSEGDDEAKLKQPRALTDEELFKACGGRTAHKAARFGLKLNGKLARIAAQDAIISAAAIFKPRNEVQSLSLKDDEVPEEKSKDKKKKKKKKKAKYSEEDDSATSSTPKPESEVSEVDLSENVTQELDNEISTKKRKKKDKKRKYELLEEADEPPNSTDIMISSLSENLEDDEANSDSKPEIKKKKSKKHKSKRSKYEELETS